jgi:lincosamide nucleotidyltransferase A/C/D/E
VRLAADGSGVQAGLDSTRFNYPAHCFTTGSLSTHEVPCLTASHQRLLHTGYAPRTQDVHDLQLLDTLEQAHPG